MGMEARLLQNTHHGRRLHDSGSGRGNEKSVVRKKASRSFKGEWGGMPVSETPACPHLSYQTRRPGETPQMKKRGSRTYTAVTNTSGRPEAQKNRQKKRLGLTITPSLRELFPRSIKTNSIIRGRGENTGKKEKVRHDPRKGGISKKAGEHVLSTSTLLKVHLGKKRKAENRSLRSVRQDGF